MALATGTRIGPYEIIAPLGAGGMGEVFRARDTRLARDVALKVLPPAFATDPDRLARFEREARTLASLNHPHIAQVYGLEDVPAAEGAGTARALVMELVDGEDLSARLARGPLPLEEALPVARQIADALDAAHEAGIIHRDLKPANIKLRTDGTVKVLDFGLAKPGGTGANSATGAGRFTGAAGAADAERSPTFTSPNLTEAGMLLGTAAYMAPEQAKGKAVDRRADIWAFGCVLYEMLAGRLAFPGDDVTDTLTSVLRDTPDWQALPPATPAPVRRLLARCLERDPKKRLRDIGDAVADLGDEGLTPAVTVDRRNRVGTWHYAVATALVLVGAAAGILAERRWWPAATDGLAAGPIVTHIAAPPDVGSAFVQGFALSPDAATLAFAARDSNGVQQIWLRRIDDATARPLAGTEGGRYPFWSPDGAHVAFFTLDALRRVPAAGGPVQTICPTQGTYWTGSWNEHDEILFGVFQRADARIFAVPAGGGTPRPVTSGLRPQWIAGGRSFIYADTLAGVPGIYVTTTDAKAPQLLDERRGNFDALIGFAYSPGGYLFANQGDALTVRRLDAAARTLSGPATTVAGAAGTPLTWMAASGSQSSLVAIVARSSTEVGNPGDPLARLKWVNRQGDVVGELGDTARYWAFRLAPDSLRAVVNFSMDLWLLGGGSRGAPLTPTTVGWGATWSPDGREVAYTDEPGRLMRRDVDGRTSASPLGDLFGRATDWSRDGRSLLLELDATNESRDWDVALFDLASGRAQPWLATSAFEGQARFSPDGRWIAYSSFVRGRHDVLVGPRAGGASVAVSKSGGSHPAWRGDGRELFYLGPRDEIMSVAMSESNGQIVVGEPQRLFQLPLNDVSSSILTPYDVTADGQRFLINVAERPLPLLYINGIDRLLDSRP